MSPHGEDKYFMKCLRLSLAHAVPLCTQEAQAAETKTDKEVDEQPSNRNELVFQTVRSTSPPLALQPHLLLLYPIISYSLLLIHHSASSSSPQVPFPTSATLVSKPLLSEVWDQIITTNM